MWIELRWLRIMRVSGLLSRVRIVLHQLLLPHVLLDLVALVWRQAEKQQPACQVDGSDIAYPFDVIRLDAADGGFTESE
jgi:hypothetical protein